MAAGTAVGVAAGTARGMALRMAGFTAAASMGAAFTGGEAILVAAILVAAWGIWAGSDEWGGV